MDKFTPGPWSVDNSCYEGPINRMEPFRDIGMVINHLHDQSSREENVADAKLIAAAPDLLAALEALTADHLFYFEADKTGEMNVTVDAYEAARAAIA